MTPLDQWDDLRPPLDDDRHCTQCGLDRPGGCHCGHYVVEYGVWDEYNHYTRCNCNWVGLAHLEQLTEEQWNKHITDQAKLAERLSR